MVYQADVGREMGDIWRVFGRAYILLHSAYFMSLSEKERLIRGRVLYNILPKAIYRSGSLHGGV